MKKFIQFNVEDRKIFEDYLNYMSKQGYAFKEMDAFTVSFEKSNQRKYYYVDLYEKLPLHHSDYSKEDRQKQVDIYEEMGCTFKYIYEHFMIYESNNEIEIHTDLIIEDNLIKDTKKRSYGQNSSKTYLVYGIFYVIAFFILAYIENLSDLSTIIISTLSLLSIIYMYIRNKNIENKKDKEIKDLKFKAISYLFFNAIGILLTFLPFLLTRSFMQGLIDYYKSFGACVTLFILNTMFSKYDNNHIGKKFKIILLLYVIGLLILINI